jgi:hypothetical protein
LERGKRERIISFEVFNLNKKNSEPPEQPQKVFRFSLPEDNEIK